MEGVDNVADTTQIGAVKAAITLFGERINEEKPQSRKTQMTFSDLQKGPPSRAKDLHLATRDIGLLNENRKAAESVKAQAESELFAARMRVAELTSRIKESNLKAKAQKYEPEKLQKHWSRKADSHQLSQVMEGLNFVKGELSKLKLEKESILEEKLRAEKEFEASVSRLKSQSSIVERLTKELEEMNEEQVLVHLARIEAVKELGAIEAQRRMEASLFSDKLGRTKNRIKDINQEIEHVKEWESKLAATISDVEVLQNQLQLVKAMDQRDENTEKSGYFGIHEGREGESQASLLQSISEETDRAKKELSHIKDVGYQLMASMDIIRDELRQISEESVHLKTLEDKAHLLVQNLKSKLSKGKSKLEDAYRTEDKQKTIVSNLSETLQRFQTETKSANRKRELLSQETESMRTEVQKTECDSESAEVMLEAAMKELEVATASEATALESLKIVTEKIMKARALASQHNSSITITNFEYQYLTSCAKGAEEIADKKVAAAQAWIEALKASEKEILVYTETVKKEIRELRLVEEQEVYRREKSMKVKREIKEEPQMEHHEKNPDAKNMRLEKPSSRKSIKNNGSLTPTARARSRRPSSPGTPLLNRSTSTPITIRKRRLIMPNLVKIFARKRTEKLH